MSCNNISCDNNGGLSCCNLFNLRITSKLNVAIRYICQIVDECNFLRSYLCLCARNPKRSMVEVDIYCCHLPILYTHNTIEIDVAKTLYAAYYLVVSAARESWNFSC